jgi:hypothetical protein
MRPFTSDLPGLRETMDMPQHAPTLGTLYFRLVNSTYPTHLTPLRGWAREAQLDVLVGQAATEMLGTLGRLRLLIATDTSSRRPRICYNRYKTLCISTALTEAILGEIGRGDITAPAHFVNFRPAHKGTRHWSQITLFHITQFVEHYLVLADLCNISKRILDHGRTIIWWYL